MTNEKAGPWGAAEAAGIPSGLMHDYLQDCHFLFLIGACVTEMSHLR
jgi:hypothetical protein